MLSSIAPNSAPVVVRQHYTFENIANEEREDWIGSCPHRAFNPNATWVCGSEVNPQPLRSATGILGASGGLGSVWSQRRFHESISAARVETGHALGGRTPPVAPESPSHLEAGSAVSPM